MWDKDREEIEQLITEEVEEEYNDPDYQQYIAMRTAKKCKR